ncbi:TraB/GumN family protein [Candidatus Woesearchaeota archaeon]|nr:TraB/GumN family protein [Candidatus Woesearchaeota archaeon]
MHYKNLIVIGTSHIASKSLEEVKQVIESEKPDIVALELDKKRLAALISKRHAKLRWADIKRIGIKGYLFSLIGAYVEKKLGSKVGVSPGSEMLSAFKLAKKVKAKVALIDQDIEITLRRFSDALSWKEKWNFVVDLFKALIFRKSGIDFDLSSVPSNKVISKLMSQVKKRYPNIYKVLVVERNKVMAGNLADIHLQFPDSKIIAVVGAGHENAIVKLFKQEIRG